MARVSPNPEPALRIIRRRTVDLDSDAAEMVKVEPPAAQNEAEVIPDRPAIAAMKAHPHMWGMLFGLAVVIGLAFTLLPRAW